MGSLINRKSDIVDKELDGSCWGGVVGAGSRVGAYIMMASTFPFLVVQLPLLPGRLLDGSHADIAGCIVAFLGLLAYSTYQVILSPNLIAKFAFTKMRQDHPSILSILYVHFFLISGCKFPPFSHQEAACCFMALPLP